MCQKSERLGGSVHFRFSRKGAEAVGLLPVLESGPGSGEAESRIDTPVPSEPVAVLRVDGSPGSAEVIFRVLPPEEASRRDTLQEQRST